ncbi:MAG: hypothetical protein MZV65_28455 [Chromatiales bacterium]|nr:hypothetical protein [Chromatiales bacterium]
MVHTAGFDKLSGLYLSNPPKLAPIPDTIDPLERDEASEAAVRAVRHLPLRRLRTSRP